MSSNDQLELLRQADTCCNTVRGRSSERPYTTTGCRPAAKAMLSKLPTPSCLKQLTFSQVDANLWLLVHVAAVCNLLPSSLALMPGLLSSGRLVPSSDAACSLKPPSCSACCSVSGVPRRDVGRVLCAGHGMDAWLTHKACWAHVERIQGQQHRGGTHELVSRCSTLSSCSCMKPDMQ